MPLYQPANKLRKLTSREVGNQAHFCEVHAIAPELFRNSDALIKHDTIAAMCEHASPNLHEEYHSLIIIG